VVGDCYSSGGDATGAGNDSPIINGGDGEDILVGDNYAGREASGKGDGEGDDVNMLGGDGNDKLYGDHHPVASSREGGGKDEPRGGDGNDRLEGAAPRRTSASGGDGKDKFVTKGDQKCEETTGDP
jgi:Ca2+-binding RTX toxin-like protein